MKHILESQNIAPKCSAKATWRPNLQIVPVLSFQCFPILFLAISFKICTCFCNYPSKTFTNDELNFGFHSIDCTIISSSKLKGFSKEGDTGNVIFRNSGLAWYFYLTWSWVNASQAFHVQFQVVQHWLLRARPLHCQWSPNTRSAETRECIIWKMVSFDSAGAKEACRLTQGAFQNSSRKNWKREKEKKRLCWPWEVYNSNCNSFQIELS